MGKRGRPKRSERDDVAVKLDRTVVERAKVVATRRRTTLAELLSETLRGPIDKAYKQEVKTMSSEEGVG